MALRVTSEANPSPRRLRLHRRTRGLAFYRGARYGTLRGGTTETLRDLIGKRGAFRSRESAVLIALGEGVKVWPNDEVVVLSTC